MGRDVDSCKMTGLGWRQRAKKLFHCCHFDPYYTHRTWPTSDSHVLLCTVMRENPNPGEGKLRLPIPWQCRRVSFRDCVHTRGHSPGRASTCRYRRKVTVWRCIWLIFFYVLSYVGEDSTASDALGPRSKIALISNMLSLEATSRKSKVLDILLSHLGT